MSAQCGAAALFDGRHNLELREIQVALLRFAPGRSVGAEDVMHDGKISYPLQHYVEKSVIPVELDEFNSWIDKEWHSWNQERRANYLRDTLFPWRDLVYWDGDNLGGLRSKLIEEWLASPELPRKSPFGIPHRAEE